MKGIGEYIKKPIKITAVRFIEKTKDQVYTWATSIQGNVTYGWNKEGKPILKIPTLEGDMECALGDYLIVEPFPTEDRKLYPCKPFVFESAYEEVVNNKKNKS